MVSSCIAPLADNFANAFIAYFTTGAKLSEIVAAAMGAIYSRTMAAGGSM